MTYRLKRPLFSTEVFLENFTAKFISFVKIKLLIFFLLETMFSNMYLYIVFAYYIFIVVEMKTN